MPALASILALREWCSILICTLADCDSFSIEYNKKKDKKASIKFVSDPSSRTDDTYKSGTVNVGPGEPASARES